MSAPSGYTALDFVGFTDKGTYSPIVNYMRNDLVHYGGNIMRCLIDNTLNVTPVVGANWELWVGASANLVERVIAPLENNPADVAFGVGRQIIYDDWLWEVIAPIAVGDALIDYDVDPTNANIKKSAPVETQLLAVKAEADATDNMIAPTEANASSSSAAYSVGKQLILNNILYDVIADIQIGDALTTGTGGNIKAADTLTDQLAAKANSSDLAAVATSGAYSDLSGKPTLATVATSGSYSDLSNKPTLGTAAAKNSTNAVTSGSTNLVESGAVASELATINSSIQTLEGNDEAMLNVLGAKNLLPNNATSQTVDGVTFTVNSDGSVTANGTATKPSGVTTSGLSFYIVSSTNPHTLKKGTYKLTGWVDEVPDTVSFSVANRDTYTNICTVSSDFPEQTFTLSGDTSVYVVLWMSWGTTINKTFYPMVRPASVADDTYVPYAMTNRELSDYEEFEDTSRGSFKINRIGKVAFVSFNINSATYTQGWNPVFQSIPKSLNPKESFVFSALDNNAVTFADSNAIPVLFGKTVASGYCHLDVYAFSDKLTFALRGSATYLVE